MHSVRSSALASLASRPSSLVSRALLPGDVVDAVAAAFVTLTRVHQFPLSPHAPSTPLFRFPCLVMHDLHADCATLLLSSLLSPSSSSCVDRKGWGINMHALAAMFGVLRAPLSLFPDGDEDVFF